ncbi:MAG: hypothetical protein P9F75_17280 [Candidatus Contendobacter sp.]|nr:hypothetical protein [Candidatus Contendobacter sp.]
MSFVVCMEKAPFGDFSTEDLTVGKLYELVEETDLHGMVRIVDDSGEDYLYPERCFAPVQISTETAERLHKALATAV